MKVLFLMTLSSRAAYEPKRSSSNVDCGYYCMDLRNIWCMDFDRRAGTCFDKNNFNEDLVKRLNKGSYNDCSNNWLKFKGIKYFLCPRDDKCEATRNGQSENLVPNGNQETTKIKLGSGFGLKDACGYHFLFPRSGTWGDRMKVKGTLVKSLVAFVSYGLEWKPDSVKEYRVL
jgi:hypothetical protein